MEPATRVVQLLADASEHLADGLVVAGGDGPVIVDVQQALLRAADEEEQHDPNHQRRADEDGGGEPHPLVEEELGDRHDEADDRDQPADASPPVAVHQPSSAFRTFGTPSPQLGIKHPHPLKSLQKVFHCPVECSFAVRNTRLTSSRHARHPPPAVCAAMCRASSAARSGSGSPAAFGAAAAMACWDMLGIWPSAEATVVLGTRSSRNRNWNRRVVSAKGRGSSRPSSAAARPPASQSIRSSPASV